MHRATLLATLLAALLTAPAIAKLPAPSDEAKAKAAEAAAKTAWADKVGAYQLCQAMNRVTDRYHASTKDAPAAVATPPCADPGPFVAPAAAASSPPAAMAAAPDPKAAPKK